MSSIGPSLAHCKLAGFQDNLFAAWRGGISAACEGDDQSMYYASTVGHKSTFSKSEWSPPERIPGAASSIGPSLAFFQNKLYAAWKGMGDDQSIWYATFDGLKWSRQAHPNPPDTPNIASSIGPSLAVFQNQLYAAWINTDQSLWYASFDGSNWSKTAPIPNVASSIGPSLAVFQNKLYAAWKGEENDQNLWYASFDGLNWSTQAHLSPPGTPNPNIASSIGPALSEYNGKLYAMWKGRDNDQRLWYASFDGSNWSSQSRGPGNTGQDEWAPTPSGGLRAESNYVLNSNCNPIKDLSVTIEITQDLVGIGGVSIQLNCNSPQNKKCVWQQPGWGVGIKQTSPEPLYSIYWSIENWTMSKVNLFDYSGTLLSIPMSSWSPNLRYGIPAGYKLKLSLGNDEDGNITSARFIIVDNHGVTTPSKPIIFTSIPLADGSGLVTLADLAPVYAFQLNIVSQPSANNPPDCLSGQGTITYAASSLLTPLNDIPPCAVYKVTGETSNCIYGLLPQKASNTFVQSFCANP